ncbi:MAG: tRNA lysidine(34) synthetase TilS [Phenylobacterium sp.]|uniref:tRNA lysidine(34) synthetase TilS n=1 Tax=Phenylobacterium sp. TaxID=1871053 RepID=UPI00391BC134
MDARLRIDSTRPMAVGVSGGGDSVALALLARRWAADHGRPLLLLTVDHGLSPLSTAWTQTCRALAKRLDADFRALAWQGEKPANGLPAAARTARHRLLAEAARQAGASVLMLGHTADDLAESRRMRAEGSTIPLVREWAPSPAWPEGRDVFLLRPLLSARRAEIRAWLAGRGEPWIEDPANDDPRFARARARRAAPAPGPPSDERPNLAPLARRVRTNDAGVLRLPRVLLQDDAAGPLLAMACLCAAGTVRPPRRDAVERLAARLREAGPVAATLAGAHIEADMAEVRIMREPGEARRGGLAPLTMVPGEAVWDGRFEIAADRPLTVAPLDGQITRLAPSSHAALAALPPKARRSLPAIEEAGGVACPVLAPLPGVSIRPLAYERLLAACGAAPRET